MQLWERGHVREHDYVHRSAGERVTLRSLLIQTVGTHVRICDFCVSERLAVTSGVLHGLQLSFAVINIPAVEILACVGEAWQDSFASPSLLSAQTVICLERHRLHQGDEKQPRITSDRSFIILLACLSVTHTLIFMFYFSSDMFCCCWLIHSTTVIPPYPDMLFALQANISDFAPWQILIDTFRAIIWVIFYRDMRIVLMEPGRNITWILAVGGCWYRQTFSRASLVLLHKSFDALLLPLWQLWTCPEKQKHWEKHRSGGNCCFVTDCVAASFPTHTHTDANRQLSACTFEPRSWQHSS